MDENDEHTKKVPETKEIYVLMQNEYRISRNIRAQWFLNHLNKAIWITPKLSKEECKEEIEVISAIPNKLTGLDSEYFKHRYAISIVPETKIIFLSTRYRLVFCLDLSPSVATVDVQNGVIFFDEIFPTLRQSLENVCAPLTVPGSEFVFQPQLHITIIAHIPNCPSGVSQVLVQGWILTLKNVPCLLEKIKKEMGRVAERVSKAIAKSNEEYEKIRVSPDCIPGTLINDRHDANNKLVTPHHVLTSEISTVLMLRDGILALLLLPENSSAGIIVITDGVIGFPSTDKQDNLLTQLRNNTISCSFLQVGSAYHPFSCFGRIPYVEWMQFISAATCGAYFSSIKDAKVLSESSKPNAYHQAFLFWSFQTTHTPNFLEDYKPALSNQSCWTVDNPHFYTVAKQSRVKKRHISGTIKVSLENVLSCRLREGYTVKNVYIDEGKNAIEVRLHLPWNLSTNFEYIISSTLNYEQLRRSNFDDVQKQSSLYELVVDGCYEFLHDVTCSEKKPIKSTYRNVVIGQFWSYVKNLSYTDQILVQLHSFTQNPAHYIIPDAIKNGVPLFYPQVSSTMSPMVPVLSSSTLQSNQFTTFWKPLCMLNINVWQKWMHTHRIGIILQHDTPLPKNLHLPNSSGRYVHIQYRHAVTALNTLLSNYSSFVLVENQFYIRFLYNEPDKPPTSFYVIHVTNKGACIIIRLAFLGGLPGFQRNEIVKELREQILNLKLSKRPPKDCSSQLSDLSVQCEAHDANCCFLLKKPVEKILIQYKKLPKNFLASIIDNPIQSHCQKHTSCQLTEVSATMLITLSKYFHHQRWVWSMQRAANNSMSMNIVSKILSVLTKIRLQEGFHFICSNLGVTYMVLEVPMKVLLKEADEGVREDSTCVVQYLLFPPHTNTTFKDSISEEEDSELPESDGELQLITECWIEPQHGVTTMNERVHQLSGIIYEQIPKVLFSEDSECISILTTFEHLCQLCQRKENTNPSQVKVSASNEVKQSPVTVERIPSQATPPIHSLSSNIDFVPYAFNLIKLLPKCHQTRLMFPVLNEVVENRGNEVNVDPSAEPNELLFEQLINNIKIPHDQELVLSVEDSTNFLLQIHRRSQGVGETCGISASEHSATSENMNTRSGLTDLMSRDPVEDHEAVPISSDSLNTPKWKCFIKACSLSRFVITMLPSSYSDLKLLIPQSPESTIDSNIESVSSISCHQQADSVLVGSEFHEKEDDFAQSSNPEKIHKTATPFYKKNVYKLPIYIYDCILSSIVTQLSDLNHLSSADFSEAYSFKYEDSAACDELTPEKMDFTIDPYKSSKRRSSSKVFLNSHRSLMDKSFSKSFVYAVYKALVLNLSVDKLDVITAIDEICEESFLEIDITDFVYNICGHVKDFMMKSSIKQIHLASCKSGESDDEKDAKNMKRKEVNDEGESNLSSEKAHSKTLFPLAVLKKHQPCEQLHAKHLDIKNRFTEVLGGFLKKIPSRPDYYVFQPVQEPDELSISEEIFPEIENQDTEDLLQNSVIIKNILTDSSSNADNPDDDSSSNKHVNTQSSISSLDDDPDSSFSQKQADWPPLFVHLLCSVKTKEALKSCSMPVLPTCLGDIQECISPLCAEIDLDDLRITLDVTCLTLPSDIQNPTVPDEGQYSTSFSSSSPIPESDQKKSVTPEEDILSDVPTNTIQGCPLRNVPDFQRDGLYKCIDRLCSPGCGAPGKRGLDIYCFLKTESSSTACSSLSFRHKQTYELGTPQIDITEYIKWLLLDEKASAALDSYPVTSQILTFVANHVKSAEDNLCCIVKEVPLKFVFGPDSSVDKFIQVFKQMTLPGYRLNEVDSFYYLIMDAKSAEKQIEHFDPLAPPASTSAKYVLVQQNLHCDDSTELKKICDDVENEKSFSYASKFSGVDDDAKSLDLRSPPPKHKLSVSAMKEKRKSRRVCPADDTETEDGSEQLMGKNRASRKSISKVPTNRSPSPHKLSSLPSALLIEKDQHHQRSQSLPLDLRGSVQTDGDLRKSQTNAKSNISGFLHIASEHTWKPDASNNSRFSPDQYMDCGSEFASILWDLPLCPQTAHSVSSTPSGTKSRNPETSSSPHMFSDVDYSSVVESYHCSNTEDGYEGDSSDTGSDWELLSILDTKRPVLPKFWLIMTVDTSKVTIFFHIRHRKKDDEELIQSKAVLTQTISVITNICKEVNQTLLLQSLHETRMCDQLLVPEESEDIWKRNELDHVLSSSDPLRTSSDDGNPLAELQEKYLEANLRFIPGTFNCAVVWVTHFRLHHRLTSNQSGSFMSIGIQALRTVLNTFSVNNRENMFVYQEKSGSVFYLRLFEETCDADHNFGKPQMECLSPSGSYYFSCQAAYQRKLCIENDNESDFRPRVNSGQSDGDRQDSVSTISMSKSVQRCIALHVHGIGEVGKEIKVDLVQVLQNRLNEGVLDRIILMLSRNPHCKLTLEDVQFIQNPNQPPFSEIHFTIPLRLLSYVHAIHIYLRQNLLHFLYNPKYMDSNRKETHFKAYSKNLVEWSQVEDNDIFLYHSQQASGYSGSKGIACIVLSLVTGQGNPFQYLGHSPPNPSAYQDGLSENDFAELTLTLKHELKKERSPGPVALIRFQIWSVGKDSVQHIEQKLEAAVRHSLWDLLTEYKVLTTPISEDNTFDDSSSVSEPSTPIRTRRSEKFAVEQILKVKDLTSAPINLSSKEMSSSVPDIAAKSQSSHSGLNDIPIFQFNAGPKSAKPEFCTGPSTQEINDVPMQNGEKCNLTYIFHSIMKPFLDFGNELGCPAISKHVFNLSSRHSVAIVLRETHNILKTHCRDLTSKIFLRKTNVMNADTEFVPFLPNSNTEIEEMEEAIPGSKRSFIIVGRNDQQWKAYMKASEFTKFQDTYIDTLKTYQKYQTHVCKPPAEKFQDSTPNSPATVRLDPGFSASTPRVRSPTSSIMDSHSPPQSSSAVLFVPRQRLILILIQDKKLSVFLYNWSHDVTNTFIKHLEKLVHWHDLRCTLLHNLVVQKLGLFHGQSFPKPIEKSEKSEKVEFGRKSKESPVPISWNVVEQLFQHHTLPRESQSSVPAPSKAASVHPSAPSIVDILKNVHPPVPLHLSSYSSLKDPVTKYGTQVQDIRNAQNKDMKDLQSIWQTRGQNLQNDSIERLLLVLKRVCRLNHYCLTPILFSPSWRWKVAPVRDHTLKPLETLTAVLDKSPSESSLFSRSRHSSGSSLKSESTQNVNSTSRSRRTSGTTASTASQSSPKPRLKNPSEEAWHQTVCNHYLKEYIQYLHTLGFVSLQTKEDSRVQGSRKGSDENKYAKVSHARASLWGAPVFYLIRKQLGGLLLFEIGLCDPYAYAHLYTIEYTRVRMGYSRALMSQFTCAFLDEVDKIKAVMHLHSFTYDYHLRTIHSYISGRQLIFRHGYHLTSFLDDFIKYYQKSPDCARNLLYAGSIIINDINMSGHQLYNYIISHNQLYGMTVLRMVPIMQDSSSMMDTEFVLVELSSRKASYKDTNDMCQMGSFDIGLLINHNTAEVSTDRHTLALNYYIILTSQRALFPMVENYTKILGSFQTVRFATVSQNSSPHSSRKTSTASMGTEIDKFESSGEETSSSSTDSRSRRSAASTLGITDEEVTYLGYFSNQETMMQEVLLTEAKSSQTHLSGVFHRAAVHCRRDFLWSSLLPRATKEEENAKDAYSSAMSYAEFTELLNLVSPVPLDDIDINLRTFLDMHISWYKALAITLKTKYHDSHREFRDADNVLYIAVTNNKCSDSFMLLYIDFKAIRAELCVVFREPPSDTSHSPDKPSQRVLSLQALVEEFVNTCCFQMWSGIVS